ncbi:MAG TPA: nucleotide exchange factor GrpE [Patescibacteria group bacterium]|nr:nucleotide exchange factor GrpE [Patescibacteria group bacterium]
MDDKVQTTEESLEDVIKQRDQYLDSWKRSAAEFENYKRRRTAEDVELGLFSKQVAIVKLLPALDSLTQALTHLPELGTGEFQEFQKRYSEWQEGLRALVKQLNDALGSLGVKKIESVGRKFDPNLHEAIRTVPGDEENLIVEEYQTGYTIGDMVIRPSQVAITKNDGPQQ